MKMWIARDSDGSLFLFQEKPQKKSDDRITWWWSNGECMQINKIYYPEVTFENSPQEVRLNLKGEDSTALKHYYDSSLGLWCIDKDPNEATIEWIRENAFRLEKL